MAISEKQFEAMTKGTIHEGKYSKVPATMPLPKKRRKQVKPKSIPKEGKADRLSGELHRAIPYMVGIRMLTQPVFWILALFGMMAGVGILWGVSERLYNIIVNTPIIWMAGMSVVILCLCKILALIGSDK